MTGSSRLAAHRAAASAEQQEVPPSPSTVEEDEALKDRKKKEDDMPNDDELKAAVDAARTEGQGAGFKSANERMSTVFASEHYAGRETLAQSLLASASLSASDIIGHLEKAPKTTAAAPENQGLTDEQRREAADEAGRKEMQAALENNKNSDIDASGQPKADKKAQSDGIWNRAYGLNKEGK